MAINSGTTFSFSDAYRVINNVIDERIKSLTASGARIDVTWGTVAAVTSSYECSVYLFGDDEASTGFRYDSGIQPNYLDPVRVCIDKRGNRWIDAVMNNSTLGQAPIKIQPRLGHIEISGDLTVGGALSLSSGFTNLSVSGTLTAGTVDATRVDADDLYFEEVRALSGTQLKFTDAYPHVSRPSATNTGLASGPSQTQTEFHIERNGKIGWHNTSTFVEDTTLQREAAGFLSMPDNHGIRLRNDNAAALAANTHALSIGLDAALNIIADNLGLQARNNGVASTLKLNPLGGSVSINNESLSSALAGTLTYAGGHFISKSTEPYEGGDLRNGSSAASNYPSGLSVMTITDNTATGWPVADGRGTVITFNFGGAALSMQIWMQRGSLGNGVYFRSWNGGTLAWRAWSAM